MRPFYNKQGLEINTAAFIKELYQAGLVPSEELM